MATVIGVLITAAGIAAGWGYAASSLKASTESLQGQIVSINDRVTQEAADGKDRSRSDMATMSAMQSQLTQVGRAIEMATEDRSAIATLGTKLDTVIESINHVEQTIAALNQKMEDAQSRAATTASK